MPSRATAESRAAASLPLQRRQSILIVCCGAAIGDKTIVDCSLQPGSLQPGFHGIFMSARTASGGQALMTHPERARLAPGAGGYATRRFLSRYFCSPVSTN